MNVKRSSQWICTDCASDNICVVLNFRYLIHVFLWISSEQLNIRVWCCHEVADFCVTKETTARKGEIGDEA